MAPLSAWLPVRSNQDFDLVIQVVGDGAARLIDEFAAVGQPLVERGLNVMAQTGRLQGESGELTLQVRLASSVFYSMGHGLDILVLLGDEMPNFRQLGLQRGSVLLWDSSDRERKLPILPEGVIAYPVPFRKLAEQDGEGIAAIGFVAMGAIFHLLGLPERALRIQGTSLSTRRSIEAGFQFAGHALVKRDIYALPPAESGRDRILLNPHRAVMLGFAVGHCGCIANCDEELKRVPAEWVAEHLAVADRMVSFLQSDSYPGACAYRGPRRGVSAFLRGNDSAIQTCVKGYANPRILAAADMPDALCLLAGGQRLIRNKLADVVGVVIEDGLASRHQSVEVDRVAEAIRPRTALLTAEHTGAPGAEVGYIAWGSAQGVVRDAVALCQNFGLGVAALYPKAVLPFPVNELESFAKTVKRVVIVESGRTGGFADRVRASCSFSTTIVGPEPGRALTPMDIFLREGLGAI